MQFPSLFYSKRLTLRPIQLADAELVLDAWANDSEVAKYMVWRRHNSLDETRKYIASCLDRQRANVEITYIAWESGADRPLGSLAFRPRGHMVEVGYLIQRSHWGRGLGTEMLAAGIGEVFTGTSFVRVWAYCDTDNVASARVMEKAGMQHEGTLRAWAIHPNISSMPRDVLVYSILAHEWQDV